MLNSPIPSLKTIAIQTALSGDWEKAIEINKSIIKEDPQDIDALNRLAFAFSILGKNKDAKSTYQKVLKIDSLNPLALRNIKKLDGKVQGSNLSKTVFQLTNTFIEEQGKTKIVELVNIAPASVVNTLRTGQSLNLLVKRSKIFVQTQENKYIGVLPDNIGKRLIKFLKGGNLYEAYVKSALDHHIFVFIRETKRSSRFKDTPSFLSLSDKALEIENKERYKDNDDQEVDD